MYEELSEYTPLRIVKNEFSENWRILLKKLACLYEYFKTIENYKRAGNNLKEVDLFSTLRNG